MLKIIKKIRSIFNLVLLSIFLLLIGLVGVLQIQKVQIKIIDQTLNKIELLLGNRISFTDAGIRGFNKLQIKNLYIQDSSDDTLIFAKNFEAKLNGVVRNLLFTEEPSIEIRKIYLDSANLRLYMDSTNTINLQFFVDSVKAKKDTTTAPKHFRIKDIQIVDSKFSLSFADTLYKPEGVDFSRLTLNKFNLHVEKLDVYTDTVKMDIEELTFTERSGFRVNNLNGKLELSSNYMHFDNLYILTPRSEVHPKAIHFSFNEYKDFAQGGVFSKVNLYYNFNRSKVNFRDIGYFANIFSDSYQEAYLSGLFTGTFDNFKSKQLSINFGQGSSIKGSFNMNGLPNPEETFLIFNLDELITSAQDINSLRLPRGKRINLPDIFQNVSTVKYEGNFTGFFRDFVAYGKLQTNLGEVYTDILFSPDTSNLINFSGNLKSRGFQLGNLLNDTEKIGHISFDARIDGKGTVDKNFVMQTRGNIYEFNINDYTYKNILIDGELADGLYNGKVNIDDPNAEVEFDGKIDLASEIRNYHFTANVIRANLYNLNIHKVDSNYNATFLVRANMKGNTIDELNGEMRLLNSLFSKSNSQIQVYDLLLQVQNNEELNQLKIKSDIVHLDLKGKYKLSELHYDFISFVDNYLPALGLKNKIKDFTQSKKHFTFDIQLRHSRPIWNFFMPDYEIADNSRLTGDYNIDNKCKFNLHFNTPELTVKNTQITNLILNANTREADSTFFINLGASNLNLSNRIDLENFTFLCNSSNDNIDFTTRWINWDTTLYKGNLKGTVAFLNPPDSHNNILLKLLPSSLTVSDTLWHISRSTLQFDSSTIYAQNFEIRHQDEYFRLDGKLSDNGKDSLNLSFKDFDLANLNFFTRSKSFEFSGLLSGDANITGTRKSPLFFSNIFADSLIINKQLLGHCQVYSTWDNTKEAMYLEGSAERGNLKTLSIRGNYFPNKEGAYDISFELDRFKLDFVNPYLAGVFEDIRGLATGILTLEGSRKKPSLNGRVNFQKTAFTIDYLKTRYNFTSEVELFNNNVLFDNLKFYDTEGNSAILNGMLKTKYLKELTVNLNINADNILCLNTDSRDNSDYYGRAFVKGMARFKGKPANMEIDLNATTGPGTTFNIPLSEGGTLTEYNFINFIDTDTVNQISNDEDEYRVDLSGLQINFGLNVTPDAEVQIIFDSKMGDIIRARGQGGFNISINNASGFRMVGDYYIEKGDYLFTLQDVINKKFKVEPGSNLRWSGDPLNANIDIEAYYRTKTSLEGILGKAPNVSTKRTSVDCRLLLSGYLLNPEITYKLELPYAEQNTRDMVASRITTEEEIGKQFLSLLVLNQFYHDPANSLATGGENPSGGNMEGGVAVNASELLSNQLSNWLSQISNDIDIGVNYRPGTEITSDEIEVALSTQLLNDRLSINGSLDMRTNAQVEQTNSVVGDVDIDYKINPAGNVRVRAFNRSNDDVIKNSSLYTQGLGIYYIKEFDDFNELMDHYMAFFNGERKKKKKKAEDDKMEDSEESSENNDN